MSSNGKNNLRLLALSFRAIDGIINGERPKVTRNPHNQGSDNTPFILLTHAMLEVAREKARQAQEDVYIHPNKRMKNRLRRKIRKARK